MRESHQPITPPSPDLLTPFPDGPAALAAALAERYVMQRELGRGGMATVYLARDVKHDRLVALKVLRPELGVALGAQRFLGEIRTTAGLQHPHVLPLLDSGEAAGGLYYVMPYVEGETLRARLEREGGLPVAEVVRLGAQVAAALDHAHRRGVVHRDIKPENILLSEGLPVLADFGIAHAAQRARDERLTQTGMSLGTPAYMSPEQVTGEREIDGRSDIYSLGCVLFEMLAGRPPFRGATAQAAMIEHVIAPVPAVTSPREPVPPALAQVVRRALAKDPAERFPTAAALAEALRDAGTTATHSGGRGQAAASPPADDASVAVLPFANLSPDPENAYFADGLTEEVISDLSQVKALRVISRTSAMRYRGVGKDLPTIARELGVRYVLEGSVRRAGNAIRVTAQLIEAATDKHLWSEKLGGTLDDVFDIQERLSRRIVEALRITLSADEARRMAARPIADPKAHDLYLRARQEMWRVSPEGFRRAEALIAAAADVVGECALLHAARAALLFQTINFGIIVDEGLVPRAEAEARRALALDPDCAPAHSILGLILGSRGAVREALPLIERAVELDPGDVEARSYAAMMLSVGGQPHRARTLALAGESVRRDPLTPMNHWAVGFVRLLSGDFAPALEDFEQSVRLDTEEPSVFRNFVALALLELGRPDDAVATLEPFARAAQHTVWCDLGVFLACAARGDAAAARAAATDELVRWATPDIQYAWHVAQGYGLLGLADEAIEWLGRAVANGFGAHEYLERHERLLDPVRGDPRFPAVLDRARRASAEMWGGGGSGGRG